MDNRNDHGRLTDSHLQQDSLGGTVDRSDWADLLIDLE